MMNNTKIALGFSLFGMLGALLLGFAVGVTVKDVSYTKFHQLALKKSDWEKSRSLQFVTQPDDILLRIVPKSDILEHCINPRAIACTHTNATPCTIYLPDQQIIWFEPRGRTATFANADDAETLVHEILHCYVPNWHNEWEAQ
jgi:hypothetical protein